MAQWTTLALSQLDAESPITQEIAEAWYSNVLAAFEGANSAPKLSNAAIDDNTINGVKFVNDSISGTKLKHAIVGNGKLSVNSSTKYVTTKGVLSYSLDSTQSADKVETYINGAWRGIPKSGFAISTGNNLRFSTFSETKYFYYSIIG